MIEKMARGKVVSCKCNANRNIIGRTNAFTIFVMRIYEDEFLGGEVTELTTNTIAQSI